MTYLTIKINPDQYDLNVSDNFNSDALAEIVGHLLRHHQRGSEIQSSAEEYNSKLEAANAEIDRLKASLKNKECVIKRMNARLEAVKPSGSYRGY